MKIYIVRHGETEANKLGVLQGTLDTPLTSEGIRLATITGQKLKGIKFDLAFTSPLDRAKNTAKIILKESENSSTKLIEEPLIGEMNMGIWEGKPFKDERYISKEQSNLFFTNPVKLDLIPNGESAREVCERTQKFLFDLVNKVDVNNVLISTHGFATRAILNFLYENKEDFWQGHVPYNLAVNIIEYQNGEFKFVAKDKVYYELENCVDHYSLDEK